MRRCGCALLTPVLVAAALGGCTYAQDGPLALHYEQFNAKAPSANTVSVCHAYGCKKQTPFTFTQADIDRVAAVMQQARRDDSPVEERRAIAYALAWMEARVGPAVGTDTDRPAMDFLGSGDPTQQDCVDESTNTTSYLTVLDRHGLLRHHTVERPFAKDNLLAGRWTHWAAQIKEKGSGRRYAVDSFVGPNGTNPAVVAMEDFYLPGGGTSTATAEKERFPDVERSLVGRSPGLGFSEDYTGSTR